MTSLHFLDSGSSTGELLTCELLVSLLLRDWPGPPFHLGQLIILTLALLQPNSLPNPTMLSTHLILCRAHQPERSHSYRLKIDIPRRHL